VLRKRPRKRPLAADKAGDADAAGAAAVALLSRRDFCSGELRGLLLRQGFEAGTVQGVIAELIERGFLSDERYAQHYVSHHAERGKGPLRIRRELEQLELEPALIEAALASGEDWARRAREVRIRRFGLPLPAQWPEQAKQARFLQYRGFSNDHIRVALGSEVIDASS
jgi:regulatory protein